MEAAAIFARPRGRCAVLLVVALTAFPMSAAAQRPWDPAQVQLTSRPLGNGVFAVIPKDAAERDHTGTVGGFVVGDEGVLVIESMINARLARDVQRLVAQQTTLPIRYLVNTSYHGDKSFGNSEFPIETLVIQHGAARRDYRDRFDEDKQGLIGLLGSGRGIEEAQPRRVDIAVGDSTVVSLGGRDVILLHPGFALTEGDLVVWVPDADVAWWAA